jgi:formate dehydrogenase iron-sulfur subunit
MPRAYATGAWKCSPMNDLLQSLLRAQQTEVERFASLHPRRPSEVARYRSLLPIAAPGVGQQYAFEVDLDACTGCKACVSGCHNMNGLDEGELWRTVGVLHGGSAAAPVVQTLTTSCHHCLEPACMIGCPAKAYEKDPRTGIVKHLDDLCIGCQYCTFTCPYDAPKYNRERGIVRKCDLCTDRLAVGEAPACVQACPNEAIAITVVGEAQVVEAAEAGGFVPGAAPPSLTLPTTQYRTQRPAAHNLLPADFYAVDREHSHPPLVAMLVLTQLSVGALCADDGGNTLLALLLGIFALGASVLHLGRPLRAWRAVLGLGTSWLSREVVGFGLFALLATIHAFFIRMQTVVAAVGLLAVGCSVMVYVRTRRPGWASAGWKFFGSTVILGAATAPRLATLLMAATALKLLAELAVFLHLRDRRHSALKRTAILMCGDLSHLTAARFACGITGGLLLPLLGLPGSLVFCVAGEWLERHLFFAATTAPRMPGVA